MPEHHEVIVVGAGFAGLGQTIALRRAGVDDVVILEKAPADGPAGGVGGTWRDNTYPGCACDIPSHVYSLSTDPAADWSRSYSPQPEIRSYLRRVARDHALTDRIRFGTEMTGARWDEDERTWTVTTSSGTEYVCRFLVSAVGALHLPQIPALPGAEGFTGPAFHSARWDHDVDLRGKRVAVVGTGASAIQFVPQIAPDVASLTLYQRTPAWVLPKNDHPYAGWRKRAFASVPGLQRAYRAALYAGLESRVAGFMANPALLRPAEWLATKHITHHISDPELVEKLTPDYSLGCKRILVSNDYYPALARSNVEVVTSGVGSVGASSITDGSGETRDVDVIIYGTGFHVTDAFDHLDVRGRAGRTLRDTWAEHGMRTHLGITVTDFPNLFFLLGPNTGLGHNSVVFMIECQARYVAQAITAVRSAGCSGLDVRAEVQHRSNAAVQRRLARGIWTRGGCTSWYLDAAGVNRTIWPGSTWRYWWETRRFRGEDFELFGRAADAGAGVSGVAPQTLEVRESTPSPA